MIIINGLMMSSIHWLTQTFQMPDKFDGEDFFEKGYNAAEPRLGAENWFKIGTAPWLVKIGDKPLGSEC